MRARFIPQYQTLKIKSTIVHSGGKVYTKDLIQYKNDVLPAKEIPLWR